MREPYLDSDTLRADLARWKLDTVPPMAGGMVARPDDAFWVTLPQASRDSFERLERTLEAGELPVLPDFQPALGPAPFAAEAGEPVFQLARERDGETWCLTGRGEVLRWDPDEGELDRESGFGTIDQLVWGLVRYEAALAGTLLHEAAISMLAFAPTETGLGWIRELIQDAHYASPTPRAPAEAPGLVEGGVLASKDEVARKRLELRARIDRAASMARKATLKTALAGFAVCALGFASASALIFTRKFVIAFGLAIPFVGAIGALARFNNLRAGFVLERRMAEADLAELPNP